MRHHRETLAKDIRSALFKMCKIPEIKTNSGARISDWKKNARVKEAYANLWKSDNNELVMINNIIMKAMPKEANAINNFFCSCHLLYRFESI